MPLDIVVDAGMSNIAYYSKKLPCIDADTHPSISYYAKGQDISDANRPNSGWKMVLKKLDEFAKYSRKDCMFIADGLRAFCIDGS